VSRRRREHDVQLIEAAETPQEGAECLDDAAVARQEREDVGVERESSRAFDRDDQPNGDGADDEQAPAMRPANDRGNEEPHVGWYVTFTDFR
jgi:hypothetical protein